ncbi:translation initiation factor IF-2 [Hwanghaeella sp. 1Z406]|jgi:translation initiation factor IF-2|uniref:translation initiation factor IF-2 n=1 Tax=Hwanghaeella sp. 1Z406 TaxID=3402811 RepID=UPI003B672A15|tara:strand:+ start:2244 stop:4811 length:2568 start_codon:yes stop_codon:yes gene_type:complete
MSDGTSKGGGKLSLGKPGKLSLSKTVESGQVRQSFSHGRSKTVIVETKSRRSFERNDTGDMKVVKGGAAAPRVPQEKNKLVSENPLDGLSEAERQARIRALEGAARDEERRKQEIEEIERKAAEARARREEEERLKQEEAAAAEEEKTDAAAAEAKSAESADEPAPASVTEDTAVEPAVDLPIPPSEKPDAAARARAKLEPQAPADDKDKKNKGTMRLRSGEQRRRSGKMTVTQALEDDGENRGRSMAALRRAREREKQQNRERLSRGEKVLREVTIPEAISVGDLANRMAERAADVIKTLMKMGVMATVNEVLDADTAELVVSEFGHRAKRVSESDVEDILIQPKKSDAAGLPRAPVVTIMGHVDHGKTSLLDALRATDVAAGEAGGITQHIGAYQVTMTTGASITFLDTPGHAAFTSMRQRGAQVTDIVVLVIAADDGIRPQTIEAINHAKAAEVPIIVAINKIDKEGANPNKAKQQLLEHSLVPEDMGGDVICVEVSATKRLNLDVLEETILLQAEVMELTADPAAEARGAVVEAKLEIGRGSVATVLVQNGTLRVGDIFVAGQEWGRVRALLDDKGRALTEAGPSVPVEVLGLQGTPQAGDEFIVLADESKAREIASYRQRKAREQQFTISGRGTLEQMFERVQAGEAEQLPIVVKTDVQGSLEALVSALEGLATDEVKVRVLHGAVGGITESDVTLAASTGGVILGFNVRANPQARDLAKRDGVDIRYYSIIYDAIDDMKSVLSGMLAPEEREEFLGYAEIREVFNITKAGKIAGCMITDGEVRRGAKVRLLRDDTVIYEGALKQLKRFKDDVKEVKSGYECGMAFENFEGMQVGDIVECFDIQSIKRKL